MGFIPLDKVDGWKKNITFKSKKIQAINDSQKYL